MRLLTAMGFTILFTALGWSQEIDSRLLERYSKAELESLKKENPNEFGLLNYALDNAVYFSSVPSEKKFDCPSISLPQGEVNFITLGLEIGDVNQCFKVSGEERLLIVKSRLVLGYEMNKNKEMKKVMKKLLIFLGAIALGTNVYGQSVTMGGAGYPIGAEWDCSADVSFDDPGAGGDYTANYNDTITFCPTLDCGLPGSGLNGTKMTIVFGTSAGLTWDVDASDSVYIYDGPNANAPLLGAHNTATDPNGVTYTASWDNPTGCITVVFITDGANEGGGWNSMVSCGFVAQPFEMNIEAFVNGTGPDALNPADTGNVDVCFGDSILFVAKPVFPHSCEVAGFGYTQTVENVNYDWNISDGGTYPNNDSIWFTPPSRNGFFVDVGVRDTFPQIQRMTCKARVSQLPSFAGTGPLEDTVCLGQNTQLIGGVTPSDTVGIAIPGGTFQLGGAFAGLTYLPDGDGTQYQAPIDITGFPAGSTITNSQDLNQVCITMEHSYLGDLEIALECPNGTQVTLLNSYDPGFIPGGQSGGGTFMGDPIDDFSGGGPGQGWEYCFSSVYNTWGDYPTEFNAGNTIPAPNFGNNGASMNPNGVYLPEEDFSAFAGCPVNGEWTIIVQDNISNDDGYIFEWGLFFDGSYLGGTGTYQNIVADENWLDDPTIVSGQGDTVLVVQPNTPGNYDYTYQMTDDFGCVYDTTVTLYVLPQPTIFPDTFACNFGHIVTGTSSYSGGTWSSQHPEIQFSPSPTVDNPEISTDALSGVYTVTYTDSACNTSVSSTIDFLEYPGTWLTDTTLCTGSTYLLNAPNNNEHPTTYEWNNGTVGEVIQISQPGEYIVTMTNACHTNYDTIVVDFRLCDIIAPNIISLAEGSGNSTWFVKAEGLSSFDLTITNRWGNVVFECTDPNAKCFWDGRNKGGDFVSPGTYFYTIKAAIESGDELMKHGFIQVVD